MSERTVVRFGRQMTEQFMFYGSTNQCSDVRRTTLIYAWDDTKIVYGGQANRLPSRVTKLIVCCICYAILSFIEIVKFNRKKIAEWEKRFYELDRESHDESDSIIFRGVMMRWIRLGVRGIESQLFGSFKSLGNWQYREKLLAYQAFLLWFMIAYCHGLQTETNNVSEGLGTCEFLWPGFETS